MNVEEWDALARRLERVAARNPRGYRVRVGLLAAAGYGYLLGMLLLVVVGAGGIVAVAVVTSPVLLKFVWPLLVLIFVVVRSLAFKVPAPDGLELRRDDAPELWKAIDDVRRRLKAPKVHKLLLDDTLNAGVVQVPRLGVIGPQRNYLLVGLPMLQALSPEQFTAVIAHELGHLSGNHSRFAGWIYRLRKTYAQLLDALEQRRSRGVALFRRFFAWYSPYFAAYSFALARQDEYEADRASADAASATAAAGALVRGEAVAAWLGGRFWPALHEHAEREPQAPVSTYTALREQLPEAAGGDAEKVVEAALERETDTGDTHPALSDRLNALGVEPAQAVALGRERPEPTAAEAFLGPHEQPLVEHFDREWHSLAAEPWRERHEEAQAARARYDELRPRHDLSAAEHVEAGQLAARFEERDESVRHLRAALDAEPTHPVAHYWLGMALLESGDDDGLEHLDRAMESDLEAVLPSCQLAYEFLMAHDREPEAQRYVERARAHGELLDAAEAERNALGDDEQFVPHGLGADVVDGIRRVLSEDREVRRGHLVRRRMRHLDAEHPAYLVAVRQKFVLWGSSDPDEVVERLLAQIQVPGALFVATVPFRSRKLRRRVAKVEGSRIYG